MTPEDGAVATGDRSAEHDSVEEEHAPVEASPDTAEAHSVANEPAPTDEEPSSVAEQCSSLDEKSELAEGEAEALPDAQPEPRRGFVPRLSTLVHRIDTFARAQKRRLVVVLIVLGVVAVGTTTLVRFTGLPEGAAFQVRDQVVTEDELNRRVDLLGALYGIRPPTDEAALDTFRRDSAKAIAVSTVLDQVAAERGIVVSEKAARDTLVKTVEQQTGSFDRAQYAQLLAETGASEADVLAEISRQQHTAQLFQQVAGPAASGVTEADMRAFYDRHPDQMVAPEQRHLRNVVVATEAEAAALAERARGGEDLGTIAEQSTLDQSTRAAKGDLGFVGRTQLEQEFGDAAFGAASGAIFGPVHSAHGWNVGQVLEVHAATPMPYEKVQQSLGDRLRSERGLEAWRTWMNDEVEKADVTYAAAFRPDDPSPLTMPGSPAPDPNSPRPAPATPTGAESPGTAEIGVLAGVAVLGIGFVGLGRWGRGNAENLVSTALPAGRRERKVGSMRRGGLICVIGGAVVTLLAVVAVVAAFLT